MDPKIQDVLNCLLVAVKSCTEEKRNGDVITHYTDAPGAKMFAEAYQTIWSTLPPKDRA